MPFAPRSVLRRVCRLYEEAGWSPVVAPEVEFYLVSRNSDPDIPLQAPVGRSGRPETSRQSYSIDAVNEFDPLFEDIYDYCERMELTVDTLIHETGAGQMEINFFHGDPMALADEVFFFKRTVREAALGTACSRPSWPSRSPASRAAQCTCTRASSTRRAARTCSAAPTARRAASSAGSSAACSATHRRRRPSSPRTSTAIAGWRASPRRRSTSQWGSDNRTVGIRTPVAAPAARRVENRVIGADANPYVAIAATLACGWLGIQKRIEPGPECIGNAYDAEHELPSSLGEALELLREDDDLREVLGAEFVTVYSEVKETEHDEFMKVISPWEREHLLLHV